MSIGSIAQTSILKNILSNHSRYVNLDIVKYNNMDMINVPNKLSITTSSDVPDDTIVITGIYVNRLDLISLNYYSTPQYWWVLAYYNNLENPHYLPYGTVLKIPSFTTLLLNNIVKS